MADKANKIENFLEQLKVAKEVNIKPSNNCLKGLKLLNESLKCLPKNSDYFFTNITQFIVRILSINYNEYKETKGELVTEKLWIKALYETIYYLLQNLDKFIKDRKQTMKEILLIIQKFHSILENSTENKHNFLRSQYWNLAAVVNKYCLNFHKDFVVDICELVLNCLKFCIDLQDSNESRIKTAKDAKLSTFYKILIDELFRNKKYDLIEKFLNEWRTFNDDEFLATIIKYDIKLKMLSSNHLTSAQREMKVQDLLGSILNEYEEVESDSAYEIKAYCYYLKYLFQDERIVLNLTDEKLEKRKELISTAKLPSLFAQYKRCSILKDSLNMWKKVKSFDKKDNSTLKEIVTEIIIIADIFNLLRMPNKELETLFLVLGAIQSRTERRLLNIHLEILWRLIFLFSEMNSLSCAKEMLVKAETILNCSSFQKNDILTIKFALCKAHVNFLTGKIKEGLELLQEIIDSYQPSFWKNMTTLPLKISIDILLAKMSMRDDRFICKTHYLEQAVTKCFKLIKLHFVCKEDNTDLIERNDKYRVLSLSFNCLKDYINLMIKIGDTRYVEVYLHEGKALAISLCLPHWVVEFLILQEKFEVMTDRLKSATVTLHQVEYILTSETIPVTEAEAKQKSKTKGSNDNANEGDNEDEEEEDDDDDDGFEIKSSAVLNQNAEDDESGHESESGLDDGEDDMILSRRSEKKLEYWEHESCSCDYCSDIILQSAILNYYYRTVECAESKNDKKAVDSAMKPLPIIYHTVTTKGYECLKTAFYSWKDYDSVHVDSTVSSLLYHKQLVELNILYLRTATCFHNAKRFKEFIKKTEKLLVSDKYPFLIDSDYLEERLYYQAIATFPQLLKLEMGRRENELLQIAGDFVSSPILGHKAKLKERKLRSGLRPKEHKTRLRSLNDDKVDMEAIRNSNDVNSDDSKSPTNMSKSISIVNGFHKDQNKAKIILVDLFNRIKNEPPTVLYRYVCGALALLSDNPVEKSFYLTETHGITYRHFLPLVMAKKFESSTECYLNSVKYIKFGSDWTSHHTMVKSIPKNITVCQLTVARPSKIHNQRLFLTRYNENLGPIVIPLGGFELNECQKNVEKFSDLIKQQDFSTSLTEKYSYWKTRNKLDKELKTLLESLENSLFDTFIIFMKPLPLVQTDYDLLQERAINLAEEFNLKDHVHFLMVLLNGASFLTRSKIEQTVILYCSFNKTPVIFDSAKLTEMIVKYEKELNCSVMTTRPLVLIIDRLLQHIPFENMPFLRDNYKSYRMPSLHCIPQHYYLMDKESMVTKNAYYVLDPDNNLPDSQKLLLPSFEKLGWSGAKGKLPDWEELKMVLESKNLFVYAGHGSGSQCFSKKEELFRLKMKSTAILMGCSSVRLTTEGEFDAWGRTVLNFLSSGCPSIMGNMWQVTDRDIDLFTKEEISALNSVDKHEYVPFISKEARQNCKLKYLTAASQVIYGLPIRSK